MKRLLALILAVVLSPIFTDCVQHDPKDSSGVSEQVRLIADGFQSWTVRDETDWWGYTVTDLDQNGRLEIISSECHGTAHFTTTQIWEINDTFDALVACKQDENCGPVIMPARVESGQPQSVPAFYAAEQNRRYYVFEDVVLGGAAGYCLNVRATSLFEGEVTGDYLAYSETLYDDCGETTTYRNAQGHSISVEEYTTVAQNYFDDLEECEARFQWIEDVHLSDIEKDAIYALLLSSYLGFAVESVE